MSTPSEKELRELDAWIAEHVMGWRRINDIQRLSKSGEFFLHAAEGPFVHERQNYIKKFSPTTDPAAAMMVLEKCLSSDNLTMPIEIDRKRHKGGRFRIETGVISNSILAIEDTLPLAICRFAKQLFEK